MLNNYDRAVFVINDDVRCVETIYEAEKHSPYYDPSRGAHKNGLPKRTQFKTTNEHVEVGDLAIVPTNTRHGFTVVKVVAVNVTPDLKSSAPMDWIVCLFKTTDYDAIKSLEAEAIAKIQEAERRREREELKKALVGDYAADLKALPIYKTNGDTKADDAE